MCKGHVSKIPHTGISIDVILSDSDHRTTRSRANCPGLLWMTRFSGLLRHHQRLRRAFYWKLLCVSKSGIAAHLREFSKRIGIAAFGVGQHDQAEHGCWRRRQPVLVRNELQNHKLAAGFMAAKKRRNRVSFVTGSKWCRKFVISTAS